MLRKPDLPFGASSRDLAHYLGVHSGQYLQFFIAFALIAQYWLVHRRIMRTVSRHDAGVTWVNMLFLLGITLLPLTTYLQGNYHTSLGTCLFLLFFASDVPGRIATRRPEHQAEHGPRSALPAPRVAVEPAAVEPAAAVVLAVILAAVVLAVVLAVTAVVVAPVVVGPVSAEKAIPTEEASQRFRGQNAAADTESEPAGSGEEALAA